MARHLLPTTVTETLPNVAPTGTSTNAILKFLSISSPVLIGAHRCSPSYLLTLPQNPDMLSSLPLQGGKGCPGLCFAVAFGSQDKGRFCRGRKKPVQMSMCAGTSLTGRKAAPPTPTFDPQPYSVCKVQVHVGLLYHLVEPIVNGLLCGAKNVLWGLGVPTHLSM